MTKINEVEEDRREILKERQAFLLETYALKEHVATLREMVAGSHALRCTCGDHNNGGDIRDPRCAEQQALADRRRPGDSTPGGE